MSDSTIKSSADTLSSLCVPVYPEYMNRLGRAQAGYILKLIDIGAVVPAFKHLGAGKFVVTASLDRTNFVYPVRRWELVTLACRLTQVWNTSMEVQVTISSWNFKTQETKHIATSYLVLVAMDEKQHPFKIPPLALLTPEDKALAAAADKRKQNRLAEAKESPFLPIEPADSPVLVEHTMTPNDANTINKVFGGVILDITHQAAFEAAKRQALGCIVIAVRQDRMNFVEPAFIGEIVRARAVVIKTWHTSMVTQVEVEATNPTSGITRLIGHSYLTFVALDPEENPTQVPPWAPQTDIQQQRAADAERRRNVRVEEELIHSEAGSIGN